MLKIVVLALLVTFCHGQDNSTTVMDNNNTTTMPSPTTTGDVMTTTMDSAMTSSMDSAMTTSMMDDTSTVVSVMTTSSMMADTMSPTPTATQEPNVIMFEAMRTYRDAAYYTALYTDDTYDRVRPARLMHFNCLDRAANGSVTNRVDNSYIFSLYLQMPVLHFLNLDYKRKLMTGIAALFSSGGPLTTATVDDLCIDGYDQNFVGEFEEGVLLRLYESMGQDGTPRRNGAQLSEAFEGNYRGSAFTTTFEGVRSIPYITDRPPQNHPDYNHPRYTRSAVISNLRRGGERVTIRPPIRSCETIINTENNYYLGQPSDYSFTCLNRDQQSDMRDSLAENPNPVNFYLEAGDYVFAVIGSIAVAVVIGLAILGYFIHPFFLA